MLKNRGTLEWWFTYPLGAFQLWVRLGFPSSELVDGLIEIGDAMVEVVAMLGVWEPPVCGFYKTLPHIRTNSLHLHALLFCQSLFAQGASVLVLSSFCGINHGSSVTVIQYGHIALPPPYGLLIYADMAIDLLWVTPEHPSLHGSEHHTMYLRESKPQKTCGLRLILCGL